MKFRKAIHLQRSSVWELAQKVVVCVKLVVTTRGAVHVPKVGENVSDNVCNVE